MMEKTAEILLGVGLAARCLGVEKVFIAIEDNKPKAIEKFRAEKSSYVVKVLKSAYPQGGEKQLIKNVLGKEIPRGKLPFDIGVVVQNVSTCFAIYEAVYLNKPLYERVITVTGSLLANPKNLLVRLGTPFKELIAFCGPLKEEPAKIITGGPMMGIAQASDEVPVIKSTTGIVLLTAKEAKIQEEEFCIRCGACVRNCPVGLEPCLINLASEKEMWDETKAYGALDCIECGLCNYVCPANRRLTQSIKRAKLEAVK
jgi:electron transport complex protein RnfC